MKDIRLILINGVYFCEYRKSSKLLKDVYLSFTVVSVFEPVITAVVELTNKTEKNKNNVGHYEDKYSQELQKQKCNFNS